MNYTIDSDIVSDLHKDAYGYRPGEYWWGQWRANTDAEKQAEWDSLIVALGNANEEHRQREVSAIERFEVLVNNTIENGAKTRESALRWIMEASTCDGDWAYFCYKHGLPYSYFKKAA